ncbi:MAG: hypothetical protein AAF460_06320, partial [Pseudomonadota bacterium]
MHDRRLVRLSTRIAAVLCLFALALAGCSDDESDEGTLSEEEGGAESDAGESDDPDAGGEPDAGDEPEPDAGDEPDA